MHIFVPALQLVAHDFDASASTTQLTLSAYIVGLALGQLTYGPISDHFGRRPVLGVGMFIYAGSCLAAVVAPTINALIMARLLQAVGCYSGLVLRRPTVRDTAIGHDAAGN